MAGIPGQSGQIVDEPRASVPGSGLGIGPWHGLTVLALAFAAGITIGWLQPELMVWRWLGLAAALAGCGAAVAHWRVRLAMALLACAIAAFGAAWVALRHWHVTPDDLAAMVGDESMLVRVEGVATTGPVLRQRTAGSMARFDYRQPATYFSMRVDALASRGGERTPVRGAVLVRVDEAVAPFHAGDRISAIGFLLRPAGPRNPGEFDFRRYVRSLGQAGVLTVPQRELLTITPASRGAITAMLLHWRDVMRRRAGAWLLADLPETDRTHRNALLASLLLGQREAQIDGIYESFQRVGLAHILAISGFHLSVLAGFVLFMARLGGQSRRWHGWLVIAVVLLYLLLVEVHMPVLRAGVMTIAGCAGMLFGRRLHVGGLVSLSAILLLLWRPDQLFDAGFQLTYGVVLALIYLGPPVRRRFFGRFNAEAATSGEMLKQWLYTATAASTVAWAVATPIAAYHFGMIAPLGIVLSVIAVPISAVLLALGYVKIVLSAVLPSAALILGVPLSIGADVLLSLVETMDAIPFSSISVPHPSVALTLAMLAWVCWWALGGRWRRLPWAQWMSLAALFVWLCWPWLPMRSGPMLRIDMLSVGDGSCYVVRSGDSTVVFDAGSSTDLNAGRRSIVPALRRLGVRSIDAIAISHANLDHYSAVLELAAEFNIDQALLTPQFLAQAQSDPLGPVAEVVRRLTQRGVAIIEVSAGEVRQFGQARWKWLHPDPAREHRRANDNSMVIRIDAPSGARALLCGDIQQEAMATLMRDPDAIDADVLELPHHGSHHEAAEAFVERVTPRVVMQSTGWTRWTRDRWADRLTGIERLVTARDGACHVEFSEDGHIDVSRFVSLGTVVGGDALP